MAVIKRSKSDFFDDTWIYLEGVEVHGTGDRQDEVKEFIRGKNHRLEFHRNSEDEKNKHSIKVFGFTKKFIGENKYLLGYLQKVVTKAIITGDFFDDVKPSRPYFRQGGRIFLDLVGSVKEEKEFKAFFEQVLVEEGFVK